MDVAVSELRAHLGDWLDRARSGEAVVITERGVPVARLMPIGGADIIERLTQEGIIARPASPTRPRAAGRRRIPSTGSVADIVAEQRR